MKKGYQAILIILILLIIAGGLALFLWRDQALNFLNVKAGVADLELTGKTIAASKDTLDTSILSVPKFVALKNNVNNFDFDSICKKPTGKVTTVVGIALAAAATSTEEAATSTSVKQKNCVLGNNIPFPVPVKKTN